MGMTSLHNYRPQLPDAATMAYWMARGFRAYTSGGLPYHGSDDAPETFDGLREWDATHTLGRDSLPVSNKGCEGSIYGTPEANMMFRAWHDSIHLREGYDFSQQGEKDTSDMHLNVLKWIGAPYDVVNAMQADVEGQARYYAATGGEFVEDQTTFVRDCIERGIDDVIAGVLSGARY